MLIITFYTKTETDTCLADKLTNIGDIGLPGWLDIGTSGYTNSRIRCNAEVSGYTGYAEMRAATSYEMFFNLSTSKTDGAWMYFKINNDDYTQLPSSDNKVNIHKDTSISGNLEAQRLSITNTTARPIEINNTMHNGTYLVATSQNYSNNDLLFALRCLPLNQLWCFGVATSNQYIISHENSTKFSIQSNGNTTISGNLESQRLTINKPSNDHDIPLQIINNSQNWFVASLESTIAEDGCLIQWITPASPTYWWSGAWGANTNEFNISFNYEGLSVKSNDSAAISENLEVGATGDNSIKIHGTGATTSYAGFKVSSGQNCVWGFQNPGNSNVWPSIKVKGGKFIDFSPTDNIIIHYKPFANWSDDRLKENEIVIESVCETLSKLRPQLYDKKPDMENDDPTTWYEESGLIAQAIYYDAPELRHLINRTNNEIDEEGNTIPLPEIPTSIDPQQDPDHSSSGKDPASVNYIGSIA